MTGENRQANADKVFEKHPEAKTLYTTPDGQVFFHRNHAYAHSDDVLTHDRGVSSAVTEMVDEILAAKKRSEHNPEATRYGKSQKDIEDIKPEPAPAAPGDDAAGTLAVTSADPADATHPAPKKVKSSSASKRKPAKAKAEKKTKKSPVTPVNDEKAN